MNKSCKDDTAEPGTVATTLGNAEAPSGFSIAATCPPLSTPEEERAMVGKTVLYAWDDNAHTGWYMDHVQRRSAPAKDKKKTPSANFVVKYTKKLTGGKLEGTDSCEFSANLCGAEKW